MVRFEQWLASRAPTTRENDKSWDPEEEWRRKRVAHLDDSKLLSLGLLGSPPRKEHDTKTISLPAPEPVVRAFGEPHIVTSSKVMIRTQPQKDSVIANYKQRDDIVELFEFDSTDEWRVCLEADGIKYGTVGWMKIYDHQFGRLLKPLEPLCAAAWKCDIDKLQMLIKMLPEGTARQEWKSFSGCHPLALAAIRGFLSGCVLLLKAGFDSITALEALSAEKQQKHCQALALICGLTGRDFELQHFDAALELLDPAMRNQAEMMFEEVVQCIAKRSLDDNGKMQLDHEAGLYEVVAKKAYIQKEPYLESEAVGFRRLCERIHVLEVVEFDPHEKWGRVKISSDTARQEPEVDAWMQIKHSIYGELLKPVVLTGRVVDLGDLDEFG